MRFLRTNAAALALVLVACGGDDTGAASTDDAGASEDSGVDASHPRDAAVADATSPIDAAQGADAPVATDAPSPTDAPSSDAGAALDGSVDAVADAAEAGPIDGAAGTDAATGGVWTELHGGFSGDVLSIAIASSIPLVDGGTPVTDAGDAGAAPPVYVLEPRAGVYQSNDDGTSWTLENTGFDPSKGNFTALAIHPTKPSTLVLAQNPTTTPHMWLTSNGAASWTGVDVTVPSGNDYVVRALRFVPGVGILGGAYELGAELPYVLVGSQAGTSWKPSPTSGVQFNTVTALAGSSGTLLFAAVNEGAGNGGGIYRSTDGAGATWTYVSGDIDAQDSADAYSLGQSPSSPNIVYAGVSPTNVNGVISSTTLYKTTDGGSSWRLMNTGMPSRAAVLAIAVHPTDPNIAYAAIAGQGVYKTIDGGATWTFSGLAGVSLEAVAISPSSPNIVFAGGTASIGHTSGLYVTTTGG
jgi:hypothetical protein